MRGGGQKVLLSDRMPVTLPSIITIILHYRGDHQTEDAEMGVIPPFTESLQLRSLKKFKQKDEIKYIEIYINRSILELKCTKMVKKW